MTTHRPWDGLVADSTSAPVSATVRRRDGHGHLFVVRRLRKGAARLVTVSVTWVQIAPIGVCEREVRFQERSGAVIGLFQFPMMQQPTRGAKATMVFTGQPVLIQRIEPLGAFMTMIPVVQWTGDVSIDVCDWFAVCEATRRRLKLVTMSLGMAYRSTH